MHKKNLLLLLSFFLVSLIASANAWIRVNQLGYLPKDIKVAVWMSDENESVNDYDLIDYFTGKSVYHSKKVRATGPLGEMKQTYRLDFSNFKKEGTYYLKVGNTHSPYFAISNHAYDGAADFVLNYMRQQRCGYNPFLRDSCHQQDAYIVYHPTKTGQHIDVRGGWHDATDCLQYVTTSANAIYQMMLAYEQNPSVFADHYKSNGLPGSNGIPDIIDEIAWGTDWLCRMNPSPEEFYNQIADDRDHAGMRFPQADKVDYGYGPGNGRPVYFCSGQPQQRGKFMNATTGVASTVGKYASTFSLASRLLTEFYPDLARQCREKAESAYRFARQHPGVCQTASVLSPYIYQEENWVDDMELAAAELYRQTGKHSFLAEAADYGQQEPVTPWMGADTASHYQWYPFMNLGHYRLAQTGDKRFITFLRDGLERIYQKGLSSPFLFGIPPIWCSNNLTTALLTQSILYRQLTGSHRYEEMETALRDWLLGCNPWGTSMIIELPLGGVYPQQPHSLWVKLMKNGNSTGGLVDGPVYKSIFNSLWGVSLNGGEDYAHFQPDKMVFHDCLHDYSTDEPTMDGTASLTFPLSHYAESGRKAAAIGQDNNVYSHGGIVRGDISRKRISLVFTAADKADGAATIIPLLKKKGIKGGFFFTGEFFERFPDVVKQLVKDGHYVGSHSYGHLLYCSWERRDSMLVTQEEFAADMQRSYALLHQFGIQQPRYFIPPYEHYNATIAAWAKRMGLQIINFTAGTGTNADYTIPSMKNYRSSEELYQKLMDYESREGLNGHFLLIHFGTHADRTDKFYQFLPRIIDELCHRGYDFVSVPDMIEK